MKRLLWIYWVKCGHETKPVTELLGSSVSATSRLLDQLVVRGMITRREDERDRRALIATLEQRRADAQIAVME